MMNKNGGITESSVLVPVYQTEDGDCNVVLVRRSENGIHGGEIAFPGGKRKSSDRTLLDTALREVREEIGLESDFIDVIEALPAVETISTGFRIFPFLARIDPMQHWIPDENEIADILEVSVKSLANPNVHGEETRVLPEFPGPLRISFFRIGPHKLWGATYRILRPLIPRLLDGECAGR
jgi:8-oxo-dGTP pyrophosphatase MutT (NUDIX family)